jgi:RNase H-fold protein (predicted Holliday junction resolvase)
VSETVLAIDPGTAKCGLAVVRRDTDSISILYQAIIPTEQIVARVVESTGTYSAHRVLVGNATNGKKLARELREALPESVPLEAVPEAYTSERARVRYDRENPPKGWRRLLPAGLRVPPEPYDDYVAILLAEDYFAAAERLRND